MSPAAAIELGNFLDAGEDDPKAALKIYSKAITQASRLLFETLVGQTKALLQFEKQDEALQCVAQLVRLSEDASLTKRSKTAGLPGIILRSADGQVSMLDMEGPNSAQIEDLIKEFAGATEARRRAEVRCCNGGIVLVG